MVVGVSWSLRAARQFGFGFDDASTQTFLKLGDTRAIAELDSLFKVPEVAAEVYKKLLRRPTSYTTEGILEHD
jgi:hypothetical protein